MENGNDVEEVYEATLKAAEYVRAGNGPMILEIMTWRKMGHAPNEAGTKYKDPAEQKAWLEKDPIDMLIKKLKGQYGVTDERLKEIDDKVEKILAEAWEYAEKAPYSEPEVALKHIYAGC